MGACGFDVDLIARVSYVRHQIVVAEALSCQPELRKCAGWDLEQEVREIGKRTLSPLVDERCVMF